MQTVYWPSSNTAALTVEPPSTTATADPESTATEQQESTKVEIPPGKTPEEIEQEAKDKEWLSIKHKFTWWYPWYRMDFKLSVNLPQGNPNIDYGWSPLPFGESYKASDNVIADIMNEFASLEFKAELLMAPIVNVLIQYIAARVAGMTGFGVGLAMAIYSLYSLTSAFTFYLLSEQNPKSWLGAFLGSAISATMGLVLKASAVLKGLTSVARLALLKIQHVMNSLWAMRLNFFDITGIAFVFLGFAFMALYLGLYLA
jgi:hypothetical protein